jgi:hypothetical protein
LFFPHILTSIFKILIVVSLAEVRWNLNVVWFFCLFFQYWGLNSGPTLWATPSALFCDGLLFKIGSRGTVCPGWLQTAILLISASWVAMITGVTHQYLAQCIFDLHFPDSYRCWTLFHVFIGRLYFFQELSVQFTCLFIDYVRSFGV